MTRTGAPPGSFEHLHGAKNRCALSCRTRSPYAASLAAGLPADLIAPDPQEWQERQILAQNGDGLRARCKTDWCAVPPELDEWIRVADSIDAGSTFFRYPTTKDSGSDSSKSAWQPLDAATAADRLSKEPGERPLKAFLLLNANDEVVEAYSEDGASERLRMAEVAMREATDMLQGVHFGMRMEMHGGW